MASSLSENGKENMKLQKSLGLFNGVTMIVGIIVGSGIFVSPKGVLQEVGSIGGSLVIWVVCGLISLIGAHCYAELGTSILQSGGDYAYIRKAFGPLPAFLFLWVTLIIILPTGNAISALTFAYYILQPFYPTCGVPDTPVRLVAAVAIVLLVFINCCNVNWATLVQDVFTLTKVVALMIIIIVGIYQIATGHVEYFENAFENTTPEPGAIALGFYSGLFSYAGWNYLNFITEELKDPYKNLPRAIWISLPLVTAIYVIANIAYFTVLSPQAMLSSNAVAVTFANMTLGVMAWIMPVFVAASTFGALNGCLFAGSRLFFVGAREGHLPEFLSLINAKYYTPIPALVFLGVASLAMLSSSDIYVLINYVSFVESIFIALSIAGLLYLRYNFPDMPRPIKVNLFFPIFFMIIMLFLIVLPLFYSPYECGMGLLITATGIPLYIIGVMWKNKPYVIRNWIKKFTIKVQILTHCVPEESHED